MFDVIFLKLFNNFLCQQKNNFFKEKQFIKNASMIVLYVSNEGTEGEFSEFLGEEVLFRDLNQKEKQITGKFERVLEKIMKVSSKYN